MSKKTEIASRFKPDPRRRRVIFNTEGPSMTKQSFKDECDVNIIVARHAQNGTLNEFLDQATATRPGTYGDFSDPGTFQEAQQIVIEAQNQFESLPAKVRDRFHNSPAEFLAFMSDEANADEALKLGLLERIQPPADPQAELKANTEALKEHNAALKSRKGPKTDED